MRVVFKNISFVILTDLMLSINFIYIKITLDKRKNEKLSRSSQFQKKEEEENSLETEELFENERLEASEIAKTTDDYIEIIQQLKHVGL